MAILSERHFAAWTAVYQGPEYACEKGGSCSPMEGIGLFGKGLYCSKCKSYLGAL